MQVQVIALHFLDHTEDLRAIGQRRFVIVTAVGVDDFLVGLGVCLEVVCRCVQLSYLLNQVRLDRSELRSRFGGRRSTDQGAQAGEQNNTGVFEAVGAAARAAKRGMERCESEVGRCHEIDRMVQKVARRSLRVAVHLLGNADGGTHYLITQNGETDPPGIAMG